MSESTKPAKPATVHPYGNRVVTYALAYQAGSVSVCGRHTDAEVEEKLGVLSTVRHGAHHGRCEVCEPPVD